MNDGDIAHGRRAYIYQRCRCDVCRAAHNAYSRAYQQRRRREASTGGRPYGGRTKPEPIYVHYTVPGQWVDRAACRGNNACEIPHGYANSGRRWRGLPEARALCNGCPVLEQCRHWIIAHRIDPCPVHVVAAMTPKERNTARRDSGIKVPGNPGRGKAA